MNEKLPDGWEWKKLGDITEIKKGKSITKSIIEEGNIPVIAGGREPAYYHNKSNRDGETITVSASGAYAGYVNYFCTPIFASDCSTIKIINSDSLLTKFIYWRLKAYQEQIYALQKGGGQPHVYPKDLMDIPIPLPPLDVQQKIVSILEKAEETKRLRTQADELTQLLLKSVFLEMFGDSVTNEKEWGIEELGNIAEVSSGLTLNGERRNTNKNMYPYLRVANVFRNKLNLDEIKYIHVNQDEFTRYLLKDNDVLIVEGHGNIEEIGRAAVWKDNIQNCVHQNHIIKVRLNLEKIRPFYISYFLNMYGNFGYFSSISRTTSGLNTISTNKVRGAKISLPPLELQKQFEEKVNKHDSLNVLQEQSRHCIQELFDSLMQKAFTRELVY